MAAGSQIKAVPMSGRTETKNVNKASTPAPGTPAIRNPTPARIGCAKYSIDHPPDSIAGNRQEMSGPLTPDPVHRRGQTFGERHAIPEKKNGDQNAQPE